MNELYEESDLLHDPFQCFYYNSDTETFPVAPHWHYYTELLYITSGKVRIQVNNTDYIVSAGDVMVLHPKAIHAFYKMDDEFVSIAGIKLDINSMTFTTYYSPNLSNVFRSAEKKKESILIDKDYVYETNLQHLFLECIDESQNQTYGYDVIVFSNLYRLLVKIVRYWQKNDFRIDTDVTVTEENYDIFNILPYISNHLDVDLKVRDIAAVCGLSYSYFAKCFQSAYGKSCKEYIEDMRVNKVEQLLLFTDFDLTYISQVTGYSDCSHMIKCFKQRKGITPKQFRLSQKAN